MEEPQQKRSVYICSNGKCVHRQQAEQIYQHMQTLLDQAQESSESALNIKIRLAGCLDICEHGPNLVVLPERVYYQQVDSSSAKRIFEQHLLNGTPVSDLVYHRPEKKLGQ